MSQLYEPVHPKCALKDVVLPDVLMTQIMELIEDLGYVDALVAEGLPVRRRVLLHGPPGCGKTSVAHAIAAEIRTRLYVVSTAQAVRSHMGESDKKVEEAFKFAEQNRCVLLIDEFDSLGTKRGDPDSSAERADNRIVNTLLTCLESRPPLGLFVACTNLYGSIDPAVLRRFDLVLEIPPPDRAMLLKVANQVLKGRFGIPAEGILDEASTPAAVVRVATERLRRKVIERERMARAQTLPLLDPTEEVRKITEAIAKPTKKQAINKEAAGMSATTG